MVTHIARLGKIIGQYSPEDLANALTWGWIEGGDHWWRAGMKDWKLVSSESPLLPEPPPITINPGFVRGEQPILTTEQSERLLRGEDLKSVLTPEQIAKLPRGTPPRNFFLSPADEGE